MNNLVRKGNTFVVPGPVTSGDPVNVGELTGVVAVTAIPGDTAVADRKGVFNLSVTATAGTVAAGEVIYIAADGTLDDVAAGGTVFGYADATISTIANTATNIIAVVLKG